MGNGISAVRIFFGHFFSGRSRNPRRTEPERGIIPELAETVIVGSVPESYTYFQSSDDMEDNAHEYIMNKG